METFISDVSMTNTNIAIASRMASRGLAGCESVVTAVESSRFAASMLVGAHVSTAGGLVQAHERAVERGCEAMQVFNQSPRQWRPTRWKPDDVAQFLELRKSGPIESVTIHAVYLINPATKDREMRKKSANSLIHALRMGDEIKADGVVVHPGSTVGEPQQEALPRVGEMVKHALSESEGCRLLLENTAGAGTTIGRTFEELRELIDLAGGDKRIGVCLDSCHMWASGFDIATAEKLTGVVDEFKKVVGIRRLKCLHVNDSQVPLGSNRDRHAIPGEGEIGPKGCAAFLSEPRFEKLPALFEGPGTSGHAPDKVDVDTMRRLRRNGLRARRR
jgi:deoxyribonuclease-4